MIIEVKGISRSVLGHENANNIDNAEIMKVCNVKNQTTTDTVGRFLHVVSSDFAMPALSARTTALIAKGNVSSKNYDGLTTGGAVFATGLAVHGGGFGLTFGTTAVISVLSGYDNNSDTTAAFTFGVSAGGTTVPFPEASQNNTRLFFGTLTGSLKATYCLPPASTTYIKKSSTDKVFVTPGAFASSGSTSTTSNTRIEKVVDIKSTTVSISKR